MNPRMQCESMLKYSLLLMVLFPTVSFGSSAMNDLQAQNESKCEIFYEDISRFDSVDEYGIDIEEDITSLLANLNFDNRDRKIKEKLEFVGIVEKLRQSNLKKDMKIKLVPLRDSLANTLKVKVTKNVRKKEKNNMKIISLPCERRHIINSVYTGVVEPATLNNINRTLNCPSGLRPIEVKKETIPQTKSEQIKESIKDKILDRRFFSERLGFKIERYLYFKLKRLIKDSSVSWCLIGTHHMFVQSTIFYKAVYIQYSMGETDFFMKFHNEAITYRAEVRAFQKINEHKITCTYRPLGSGRTFIAELPYWVGSVYIDKPTLGDLMKPYWKTSTINLKKIMRNFARAIDCIHKHGIIHRDLKLENVLVDPVTSEVYLIDFGLSQIVKNLDEVMHDFCGAECIRAPEIVCQKGYTYKCDWFSYGVCLYYTYVMITRNITVVTYDFFFTTEEINENIGSDDIKNLLFKLITVEEQRLSSYELLMKEPYFAEENEINYA